MSDESSSGLPTAEQLYARHAATLAGLRRVFGERPIEVATTGELGALLLLVPADTPLAVDGVVRIDPDLDEGVMESRTAVVAAAETVFADTPIEAVDAGGASDFYGAAVAGVVLGAVRVSYDGALPVRSVAAEPYDRAIEALHAGDPDSMLAALHELICFVAGMIDGTDDANLQEWIADADVRGQLAVEGDRLRQSAQRLAVLRSRVAADVATQHAPWHSDGDATGTATDSP
jgi:hypothetical protein